jgi:hypothetical protein
VSAVGGVIILVLRIRITVPPFLFMDDPQTAIPWSNLIAVALLFLIGYVRPDLQLGVPGGLCYCCRISDWVPLITPSVRCGRQAALDI